MTGIISTSTREAVARAQGAKAVGARGVMVTPPIYQTANFDGMIDFYDHIHRDGGLPVTIYNVLVHNPVTPDSHSAARRDRRHRRDQGERRRVVRHAVATCSTPSPTRSR